MKSLKVETLDLCYDTNNSRKCAQDIVRLINKFQKDYVTLSKKYLKEGVGGGNTSIDEGICVILYEAIHSNLQVQIKEN